MPSGPELPVLGRVTDEICERLDAQKHRIDGRELSLPMEVADCSLVVNAFLVKAARVERLLEGTGLTPACVLPGTAVLLLMGVEYRDNPLGDYNEAAVLVSAYPPGEGARSWIGGAFASLMMRVPFFVYRMPVDQEFTTHAGRFLWGYPKYLAEIDVRLEDKRASVQLTQDGEPVVTFSAPAARGGQDPEGGKGGSLSDRTGYNLTWRNGQLRRIAAKLGGGGLAYRMGGELVEVGEQHPLALQLRELGLPKRPLVSASLARARMGFGVPDIL